MKIRIASYSISFDPERVSKMSKPEFVSWATGTLAWTGIEPETLADKLAGAYEASYGSRKKKKE